MAYSNEQRRVAASLKKQGFSYSQISAQLGVAKSTLSTWIGNSPRKLSDRKKQLKHLAKIRILAAKAKRAKKQEWINTAHEKGFIEARKLSKLSKENQKALLSMLYWAEGSKHSQVHGLKFVNTDPILLRLYMTLLRNTFKINEERLGVRLYLHDHQSHKKVKEFWSKELSIPISQFAKVYVKKRNERKKFRKKFMGMCCIEYYDSTIREELLALGRELEDVIYLAPVV